MNTCIRIVVSGKVQGVFYRASAKEMADRLGLSGWVRNRSDGSVEIVACGTETARDGLVQWCHKGPPAAVVSRVDVVTVDEGARPRSEGFSIRPDA